jgi:acyl-CoA synthetase (AMP-forming)/AMP-acid ligase II
MITVLSGLDSCHVMSLRGAEATSPVGNRFLEVACRCPGHAAIVTPSGSYSYAAIAAAAVKVSQFLRRRADFVPGCRVALAAGNTPEYAVAFYGILLAHGVVVPLPVGIESSTLDAILADCGARLLLTERQSLQRLPTASRRCVEQLNLAQNANANSLGDTPRQRQQEGALILYTSGSTGKPKGVLLSHGNLLANTDSILDYLPIRPSDRSLSLLPFCHAYGNSVLQTHLLSGATLIVDGSTLFPNTIVDALERHGANSFAGVPEMYSAMLACSDLGTRKLPQLRYMTVAGGALAPGDAIEVAERIAPAEFYVMYGQTEATARLAYLTPAELQRRPTSIGKAIPHVELQVRHPDGRAVAVGESGELCARGANVMLGYWQNAAATARVVKDGWLHTGDLARVDEEGFFYVTGRRNQQVKIRGLKVVPGDVAAVIARHLPDCRVSVVPFERRNGTRLALFVAANSRGPALPEEILRICQKTLARHQLPSHVEVLDSLPLTASLKVDLHALTQRATRLVQRQSVPQ